MRIRRSTCHILKIAFVKIVSLVIQIVAIVQIHCHGVPVSRWMAPAGVTFKYVGDGKRSSTDSWDLDESMT